MIFSASTDIDRGPRHIPSKPQPNNKYEYINKKRKRDLSCVYTYKLRYDQLTGTS